MEIGIRLTDREITQYARHGIAEINLSDLGENYASDKWDGLAIDTRNLNTISVPRFYWQRGELRPSLIQNPRVYVVSAKFDPVQRAPAIAKVLDDQFDGFLLRTRGLPEFHGFWEVEPILF